MRERTENHFLVEFDRSAGKKIKNVNYLNERERERSSGLNIENGC